jgi:restriction system protein
LRRGGYEVEPTKATGDFGVDLVARRGAEIVAVQCKRYARPVSGEAIQQVVAGAVMYNCTSTMVVSSQAFTVAAIELARRNNCQLIDKAALQKLDERGRSESVESFSRAYIVAAKGNWHGRPSLSSPRVVSPIDSTFT